MLTKTYELSMVGSGGDAAKQRINYILFNVFGLYVCIKLSFIKYVSLLPASSVFFSNEGRGQAANSFSRMLFPIWFKFKARQ